MQVRSIWLLAALSIVLGLGGLYLVMRSGLDHSTQATAAEELELAILVDEPQLLVGQPLQLKIRLINKSQKDLTGPFHLSFKGGRLHLLIASPGQPFTLYFPASLQQAQTQDRVLRHITLKAGKELTSKEFVSYDVKTQDFAFPKAGDYRLKALLFFDPKDPKKQLGSNEIKVTITEPQEKEKEALQFIVDNQLKPYLTPESRLIPPPTGKTVNDLVKLLREFPTKFPESAYGPYVLVGLAALCQGRQQELPACAGDWLLGSSIGPVERASAQPSQCPPTAPNSFCILSGHTSYVYAVAFSSDSQLLASGSCVSSGPPQACEQGEIRLWQVNTGQFERSLRGPDRAWILALAFHPEKPLLASSSEQVYLWEFQTGRLLRTLPGHLEVQTVAFNPDGKLLASGDLRAVQLWEVETGTLVRTLEVPGGVYEVAFSPDGKLLASAPGWPENAVRLWEVSTGQLVRMLQGHTSFVYAVAFSSDGRLLASASDDTTVRLWDVASGELVQTLSRHTLPVTSVAFSPKGEVLASGSSDTTIHLWDVTTGGLIRTLRGHSAPILAVAFNLDGKLLASASADQTVRLWYVGDLTGR